MLTLPPTPRAPMQVVIMDHKQQESISFSSEVVSACVDVVHGGMPELAAMSSVVSTAAQGRRLLEVDDGGEATAMSPSPSPHARAPPSSRYKGVVPQPNGRWGAQIYERHARVWLGTFADEAAAARAYDVAALRFRGHGGAANFPSSPVHAAEMAFLAARPKAEIVDMLRKHTYDDELRHALRSVACGGGDRFQLGLEVLPRVAMFEKVVTLSDVGRLNRLVVPKLHAEKHFPPLDEGGEAAPVLLAFEDVGVAGGGKVWRFRYSYWTSSQSYVLTRGWSRFVREKGLSAGDTVAFSQAAITDGEREMTADVKRRRMFIECKKRKRKDDDGCCRSNNGGDECPDDAGGERVVKLFGANIAAAVIGAS